MWSAIKIEQHFATSNIIYIHCPSSSSSAISENDMAEILKIRSEPLPKPPVHFFWQVCLWFFWLIVLFVYIPFIKSCHVCQQYLCSGWCRSSSKYLTTTRVILFVGFWFQQVLKIDIFYLALYHQQHTHTLC